MKTRNPQSLVLIAAAVLLSTAAFAQDAGPKIRFKKAQLDNQFRSEGVAVGDFNRDGKLDIVAGFVWYEAPSWTMRVISEEPPAVNKALLGKPPHYDPKGYSNSFCNFCEDVNGDGWADVMVVDFPGTPTWWFENPQNAEKPWKRHVCTPVTNNESPQYVDVTGDGRRDLLAPFSPDPKQPDGPDRQMAFMTPDEDCQKEWHIHAVSVAAAPGTRKYSHGLGAGDVNGDGKTDLLCADGWWEAPSPAGEGLWEFHQAEFGERAPREGKAAHLIVSDFDGDGDGDVLSSSPHAFGIWWHEQLPGAKWETHEIDLSFSQTHAICLADINDDGLQDFVTGKRWWAHGGKDPGGDQDAVLYWFEQSRADGRTAWIRHQLDHSSGIGTQFEVADVNSDGLLDVVTANKRGVFYFQQDRE